VFIARLHKAFKSAKLKPLQGHGICIGSTLFYLLCWMMCSELNPNNPIITQIQPKSFQHSSDAYGNKTGIRNRLTREHKSWDSDEW
jgi:hypothetical protein